MTENNPINYCFLNRKGQTCVKARVAKIHLKHYECEKCIWRIQSEDPRHLKALERIYEKYGTKIW
jgi:hypothetical protein